jgi:glycosyltransferase involved in cell wall biosynthesis
VKKPTLSNIKIARIATVPFSLTTQLNSTLEDIENAGAKVTAICSKDEQLGATLEDINVHQKINLDFSRDIHLYKDFVCLWKLINILRKNKFDIVHSITPKAGLLVAIASFLTFTPVRLHTFTGQPWLNSSGMKKKLLIFFDWLIVKLNTKCFADSESQKQFLISKKIANKDDILVLGSGSLAGIDLSKFNYEQYKDVDRSRLREELGLTQDAIVFLCLGRITNDKGIRELLSAFNKIDQSIHKTELLIVGPIDKDFNQLNKITNGSINGVHYFGFTSNPEKFMHVADVFCLPSYREGFGTVIIEAAAMGRPAIGTNIYGLSDAIIDNETGVLVKPMDVDSLYNAMLFFIENQDTCAEMGTTAKKRAINDFDSKYFSQLLIEHYSSYLT